MFEQIETVIYILTVLTVSLTSVDASGENPSLSLSATKPLQTLSSILNHSYRRLLSN